MQAWLWLVWGAVLVVTGSIVFGAGQNPSRLARGSGYFFLVLAACSLFGLAWGCLGVVAFIKANG